MYVWQFCKFSDKPDNHEHATTCELLFFFVSFNTQKNYQEKKNET